MLWNAVGHEIAKRNHRQHAIVCKGVIALDVKELYEIAAARASVDADRQIELFGLSINRGKIRVVQGSSFLPYREKKSLRLLAPWAT